MKVGDLIRYGARDVGIIMRAVVQTDNAWTMQTFGVPAYWVKFFTCDELMWTYKKDLTPIRRGN